MCSFTVNCSLQSSLSGLQILLELGNLSHVSLTLQLLQRLVGSSLGLDDCGIQLCVLSHLRVIVGLDGILQCLLCIGEGLLGGS